MVEEEHAAGAKQGQAGAKQGGGRRVEEDEGQATAGGAKQSLAGEFIDFYLGRAKK